MLTALIIFSWVLGSLLLLVLDIYGFCVVFDFLESRKYPDWMRPISFVLLALEYSAIQVAFGCWLQQWLS